MAAHGTPEFDREYWNIRNGQAAASRSSWNTLIASYRDSERWRRLSARTRKDYEKVLDYIASKNGNRDMTTVSRPDVLRAMEANKDRTRFANYVAQVMSILCEHSVDLGWIPSNPINGIRLLKTPEERQKAHVPWPDWAVEKARAEMRPLPLLILEIGLGTVQRPADLSAFTWGDFDGENLQLTQGKTGIHLVLPCTDRLRRILIETRESLPFSPHPDLLILTNSSGTRMTYDKIHNFMHYERERLGLLEFDLHALRYRGVMELTWAGCSDEEIAA